MSAALESEFSSIYKSHEHDNLSLSEHSTHLPSPSAHESHVSQMPVTSQLPVNKTLCHTCHVCFPAPEDGGDIVREVVPAECESVGGLREQLGRGSHVAPVAASDCRLPTLPDLSAAWLSRLSIPARTAPERLSDPTRTTFLSCNTTHSTHSVEARAMLHYCCIDQVTNIFAIAFHQSVQQADCKLQPRRVFLLFKFVYIHVMGLAGCGARHIKIKRSIVCGLLEI